MNRFQLIEQIQTKKSFLCVGLDIDLEKVPEVFLKEEDPIFEFNKMVIDQTQDLCVAYKPNTAFYEVYGSKGWDSLQKTIEYISDKHLIIADAKRGDIGNTSGRYAKAFFETMGADAITVAPYMGSDSVKPFLDFDDKWVILLGLTSNKGSQDFQHFQDEKGKKLYEKVLKTSATWGSIDNMMYVVGATHPQQLKEIRELLPYHFFLVPGVGAQGGKLNEVADAAFNNDCGLLVNSTRGIIYAGGPSEGYEQRIRAAAQELQSEMASYF